MNDSDDILFEQRGGLALVTLNRPKAFNALTLGMIERLAPQLAEWASDPQVKAVLVQGAGDKAFCAGGDIVALYRDGASRFGAEFFKAEYRLNRQIKTFAKPYIAVIDGVTMGGGVGVSVHGRFRVATEHTLMAMPESGIGFFPDVGGSYFLPRLTGQLGIFMGLTGWRLKAADCLYGGVATHFLDSAALPALIDALAAADWSATAADELIAGALETLAGAAGPAPLAKLQAGIDRCFAGETIETIVSALEAEGDEWADQALSMMAKCSPSSLKVSLRQLRLGAGLDFDAAMVMEYRLSQAFVAAGDFREGIRAQVIDKDRNPRWDPAALASVSDAAIAAYFEEPAVGDLTFDA